MVLALGGEVESAQEQLMEVCLAQGRTTSGKSVLNLHVQVLRKVKILENLFPLRMGRLAAVEWLQ